MGTAARLAAYACALGLVLGLGWGAGHLVGPIGQAQAGGARPAAGVVEQDDSGDAAGADAAGTDGLSTAADGYAIAVVDPSFQPGRTGELRFTVTGPDGHAVTAFVASPRDPDPLHVVVVRRDAAGFQRLAPTMDADGAWHTPLTLPAPGVWRAFVDMTPAAGPPLVLGADLFAAGPFDPFTFTPSRVTQIGGFQLRLDGDLVPGVPSQVFFTVSRDGVGVTGLQPYLGAFGRLVLLRDGDLAYVVAVSGRGTPTPPDPAERAGPAIAFTADVPSTGTYRLFLQFRVSDVMHTAEFTLPTRNP
ncbi:MAG TPA: hypothetical protein VGE11_12840 [Pseudonocardia sp.]